MIKRRSILLMLLTTICTLCLMCGMSVSATSMVIDDCGVLSNDEIDNLENHLSETSKTLGVDFNIAVLITDQTNKSNVMDYADVYQENLFGINSNSILYLINMNDGYDWITTSGIAIKYYPDKTINYILQSTSGTYLKTDNMDFYGAINKFDKLLISEKKGNFNIVLLIISLIIGIVISAIICGIIANRYKFHASTSAEIYAKSNDGSIEFTRREDRFIRTFTSKTEIPQNDGTSTHTSSGGGTHGGGGFQR